jgi:uncharacterized glyoxalase superfamily protein PhnB
MTGPTPYIHFPGTAREALTFYGEVFGCAASRAARATDPPEGPGQTGRVDVLATLAEGEVPCGSTGLIISC